jgi:lysophospholipase L1-like esterase
MRSRPVVLVLLVVAAVGANAVVAGATAGFAATPAGDPRVFVLGDSVLVGADAALASALPGHPVTLQASIGQSLLGAPTIIDARRAELGDVVVIGLGANDGTDPVEFNRRIDSLMATLAGVDRVIWINQPSFESGRAAMNAELGAAQARWPTLRVIDWATRVAANPGFVAGDGLHLSPEGQARMAELVRRKVASFEAASTPLTTLRARVDRLIQLIVRAARRGEHE